MSTGLSVFISGNLAAWFIAHVGNLLGLAPWRLTMLAIALPAPLLALFLLYTIAEPRRPTQTGPSASSPKVIWQEIAKDRGLVAWIILGAAFSTIHINVQLTWIPAYFQRLHQYSLSQVAWNLGIVTIVAGLLGPILSGLVSDLLYPRLGMRAPIIILVCITIGAFAQAAAPLATNPRLALAGFAVGYLMLTGGYALAPAVIQMRCAPTIRARVSSLYVAVANLAGLSLGPVAVPLAVRYLFSSNEKDLGLAIATLSALLLSLALACFLRAQFVAPRLKGA
jgi:MFS family permease